MYTGGSQDGKRSRNQEGLETGTLAIAERFTDIYPRGVRPKMQNRNSACSVLPKKTEVCCKGRSCNRQIRDNASERLTMRAESASSWSTELLGTSFQSELCYEIRKGTAWLDERRQCSPEVPLQSDSFKATATHLHARHYAWQIRHLILWLHAPNSWGKHCSLTLRRRKIKLLEVQ